jgi:hypothetical protein
MDVMRKLAMWAVAAALLAVLVGCASSPGAGKTPDWVLSAPQEKDGYMFFVGAGDRGSLADSEQAATLQATGLMLTFIGADVASQTDATVKATLDSYKADVTRSVQVKSEAKIKSFELADKWVDPKKGTAVYVLYKVVKQDLLAEQKRLADLVKEILSLVSKPEGEGASLADEGSYYDAAMKFVQAAVAASGLDIPNKDVKFERNINAAKDALDKINILPLKGDNSQAVAGQEIPNSFQVVVVTGSKASDQPVPDVSVKVSYRVSASGRMRTDTITAKSNEAGIVTFKLPVPGFVGAEKITVTLNAGPYLEPLSKAPDQYQSAITGLEQLAAQKRATLAYTVISLARDVPMGIAVAEVDAGGSPLASSETAAGILGELGTQKFRVKALKVTSDRLVGAGDADVVAYLKESFAADVKRVTFGVCQLTGTDKDSGKVVARVKATVKVADFDTGEVRLSIDKSTSALGDTAAAAAAAAFRKVGQMVAQEIAATLW